MDREQVDAELIAIADGLAQIADLAIERGSRVILCRAQVLEKQVLKLATKLHKSKAWATPKTQI